VERKVVSGGVEKWETTLYSANVTLRVQDEFRVANFTLQDYNGVGGVVKIPTDLNIMYIGDEAQDYMLSHQIKYGTGQKVVVNYVYFNMLTGIGEKGKATIAVNADGSGNSGDNAGIDIQLSKVGSAPEEFDYTVATSTEATLTALAITGATLTPAFSSSVTAYTAETTEANGTITATGADGATVAIAVNGTTSEDGSATWTDGINNVVITVKTDKITRTYTVEVTKTTA
jgi:hypothetical protein